MLLQWLYCFDLVHFFQSYLTYRIFGSIRLRSFHPRSSWNGEKLMTSNCTNWKHFSPPNLTLNQRKVSTIALHMSVARIFDWRGPKPKITSNDIIRNFQKRNILWGKDIAEWKIRSCGLIWHLSRILLKKKRLDPKVKKCK